MLWGMVRRNLLRWTMDRPEHPTEHLLANWHRT